MSDPARLRDVFADDALLDRLAAREEAGDEPLALVLGSLACYVDQPIAPSRHAPGRAAARGRHVVVAGLMALVMSGAGVAAAMTIPGLADHVVGPLGRGGGATTTSTGTPQPTGAGGSVAQTSLGVDPSRVASPGVGVADPAGGPAADQGATSPRPASDGAPPWLLAEPGTAAATSSDGRTQHGRPAHLPTPPGQNQTAHRTGPPTTTSTPLESSEPATSPGTEPSVRATAG